MARILPTANKYLFSNFQLFKSGEGGETTWLSFAPGNTTIDVSSASLEALIATLVYAWGMQWGGLYL